MVIAFGGRSLRQDDLLARLVDGVEGVEELLLRPLALGDELDVVDEQHVDAPIPVAEVLHLLLADRVDEVVRELLARRVQDPLARELAGDRVADGVHQVRLAEADAAVQEERVVRVPGPLGDAQGGRMCQAVGASDDEVVERVATVQVERVAARAERRHLDLGLLVDLRWKRTRRIGHDELELDRSANDSGERLADQRPVAIIEPVSGEAVRSGDPIAVVVDLDELGVLQPGLEVGRRERDLQLTEGGAPHLLRIHQTDVLRTDLRGRRVG